MLYIFRFAVFSITLSGFASTQSNDCAFSITIGTVTSTLCTQPEGPATTCSCGYKKTNPIIGGQKTGVNEFTMMAGLVDSKTLKIICGATIIDSNYILTSARCLSNITVVDLAVLVSDPGDSKATQAIQVASFTRHPEDNAIDNDVAILTMSRPIPFSDRVVPVCLPFRFSGNDFSGAKVTALGWRTKLPGDLTSAYVQKVNLDVIDQTSCRSEVPSLTDRQMCTYNRGNDACQDDSGGPLLYTEPKSGRFFQLGIVSKGKCRASGTPGINTRVTALLEWISTVTPDANFCNL